jgi:hypothetical protein
LARTSRIPATTSSSGTPTRPASRSSRDYVAIDYQSSIYWITSVTPSAQTWEDGDRQIVCALKLGEEGEEMTGSAEGTGR